jgi:hypothetical protein
MIARGSERGCVRSTSRSISASDDRFETPGALRLVFQTQPRSAKSGHHPFLIEFPAQPAKMSVESIPVDFDDGFGKDLRGRVRHMATDAVEDS